MKIYLHIGSGKCASSSIQQHFSYNNIQGKFAYGSLRADGSIAIGHDIYSCTLRIANNYINSTCFSKNTLSQSFLSTLTTSLQECSYFFEYLFLSFEWWYCDSGYFDKLSCILSKYDVEVIFIIRNPVEYYNSAWWQWGNFDESITSIEAYIQKQNIAAIWLKAYFAFKKIAYVKKVHLLALNKNILSQLYAIMNISHNKLCINERNNTASGAGLLFFLSLNKKLRPTHGVGMEFLLNRYVSKGLPTPWVLSKENVAYILESTKEYCTELAKYITNDTILKDVRWWNIDSYKNNIACMTRNIHISSQEILRMLKEAYEIIIKLNNSLTQKYEEKIIYIADNTDISYQKILKMLYDAYILIYILGSASLEQHSIEFNTKKALDFAARKNIICNKNTSLKNHNHIGKTTDKNYNDKWCSIQLAELLRKKGDYNTVIPLMHETIKVYENWSEPYVQLSYIHEAQGELEQAITCMRTATKVEPLNLKCTTHLSNLLRKKQDYTAATALMFEAISNHPTWSEPYAQLSSIHDAKGELEQAIVCAHKAIEVEPLNRWRKAQLANLLRKNKDYDAAITLMLEAIQSNPYWSEPHAQLSYIHDAKGELEQAITCARTATEVEPLSRWRKTQLANLLRKKQDYTAVITLMTEVMEAYPTWSEPYAQFAAVYDAKGELEQAIIYARKATKVEPLNLSCKIYLSNLLRKNKDYDIAITLIIEIMEAHPTWSEPYAQFAAIHEAKGELEQAITYARKAIEIEPLNHWRKIQLSNLLRKKKAYYKKSCT